MAKRWRYGDMRDVWFDKAIALEKLGKYEKAIKHYTAILVVDQHNQTAYHNKGVALEKLGRHDEAAKCFDEERWRKEMDAAEVSRRELLFERVWSRIIKNEGKLFKTKTGVVFSYRITKTKKSIIPQRRKNWRKDDSKPKGLIEKFPVYGEGDSISKTLVREALDIVPTEGPTELKILMGKRTDITPWITHLWGILHDYRISKGVWFYNEQKKSD